ncbi:MAG: hypothetical protein KatS3mg105_3039 [Gemmatales bacterium]|nr:MAG: hypothetical protein KatS3mg105_3039 [Gemmatales bacterium]
MNEQRRQFLRSFGLVAAGALGGWALPSFLQHYVNAEGEQDGISPETRIKQLKIVLPKPTKPKNTYVPTVRVGNLLYVAGHGPGSVDGKPVVGKVGRDLNLEQAQQAARLAGLRILGAVRAAVGSLDNVVRLVKTLGMVNATPDFKDQPLVINGFSDLIVEIFGEKRGKGARSAVGMGSLPGGIPVEIETIFQIRT